MEILEFKKVFKRYNSPSSKQPEILDMSATRCLMIDGCGSPESDRFRIAIEALYSVIYTLKFARKKAGAGPDYSVGALEGLWWTGDGAAFDMQERDNWLWTLMIWAPECITTEEIDRTKADVQRKKPNPLIGSVRLDWLNEGTVAQVMHIGPYADEGPTIERLHAFIAESGYMLQGRHHEIYLGDPRRTSPEKLRTILRQPIALL